MTLSILGISSAQGFTGTTIASDTFRRSVTSGWGAAPTGGNYSLTVPSGVTTNVAHGTGNFSNIAAGRRVVATLPLSAADVSTRSSLTLVSPTNLDLFHTWRVRETRNSSAYYAVTYRTNPKGDVILSVSRVINGTSTWIKGVNLPTRAINGTKLWIEAEVTGTSPVNIQARAWHEGTPTPGWQLKATDSHSSRITAAGRVSLDSYVAQASTRVTLKHDDIRVLSATKPTAPAPTAPAPTLPAPQPIQPTQPAPQPVQPTQPVQPAPQPAQPVAAAPRGATLGSTSYPIPARSLVVSPSGNDAAAGTQAAPLRTVAAALNKVSSGGTIVLRAGTYHESVIVPYNKTITMQNYPGEVVWFDGSVPVTNWTQSGTTWISNGWTKQFSSSMGGNAAGFLHPDHRMANYPDQVFIDGVPQAQVRTAAEVSAGKFFADYANRRLIIGTNPNGRDVRASDLEQAIKLLSPDNTLQGFGVRRYATPYELRGAIQADPRGGVFRQLVVQDNATIGMALSNPGKLVDQVTVTGNGMLGLGVHQGDGLTITNSIVSQNNAENFNFIPVAGGIKITTTKTLRVENNEIRSNSQSMGLWLDEFCSNFTLVNNIATDNGRVQIEAEISSTGIIANNVATGGRTGIRIYDTDNVKVFNNHVGGQTPSGSTSAKTCAGRPSREPVSPCSPRT